jgi:molybdopterin/thiamine biosynthesis adenylyltransferase
MIPEFLTRSSSIYGEDGYEKLSTQTVSISGLGGVGGLAFISLVRSGVKRFKLAENGIFDMPDLNRQALAYRKTINRPKIDVYQEYAKDINPDIELEIYPEGSTVENIEKFIEGSDAHIRVIDYNKGSDVRDISFGILDRSNVPLFQANTVWTSSMLFNYKPGGMKPSEFRRLLDEKSDKIRPLIFSSKLPENIVDELRTNRELSQWPTTCIGANMAALLLVSEVLVYLLKDTKLVDRDNIYLPNFVFLNAFKMKMEVLNIEEL